MLPNSPMLRHKISRQDRNLRFFKVTASIPTLIGLYFLQARQRACFEMAQEACYPLASCFQGLNMIHLFSFFSLKIPKPSLFKSHKTVGFWLLVSFSGGLLLRDDGWRQDGAVRTWVSMGECSTSLLLGPSPTIFQMNLLTAVEKVMKTYQMFAWAYKQTLTYNCLCSCKYSRDRSNGFELIMSGLCEGKRSHSILRVANWYASWSVFDWDKSQALDKKGKA